MSIFSIGTRRRSGPLGALLVVTAILVALASSADRSSVSEGFVPGPLAFRNDAKTVEAAFGRESYRPGHTARLRLFTSVRDLTVQILQAGPERIQTRANNVLNGVPVTQKRRLASVRAGRTLTFRVGRWPSGLYFARLTAPRGRVGYAPFVIGPSSLGEHPVAVVLPTLTWQAYNRRDDDGDGSGDTWYAGWKTDAARLGRPFLSRGVPFNFRGYDLPFLRWLARTGRQVDVLADSDLDAAPNAKALAEAYELIVFPGHHE